MKIPKDQKRDGRMEKNPDEPMHTRSCKTCGHKIEYSHKFGWKHILDEDENECDGIE